MNSRCPFRTLCTFPARDGYYIVASTFIDTFKPWSSYLSLYLSMQYIMSRRKPSMRQLHCNRTSHRHYLPDLRGMQPKILSLYYSCRNISCSPFVFMRIIKVLHLFTRGHWDDVIISVIYCYNQNILYWKSVNILNSCVYFSS